MDIDEILNFHRLYCTGDVAKAGWVIDQDAVIEAIDILGIKLPVHIKFTSARSKNGSALREGTRHRIILVQTRKLEYANATLWHELAHCKQSELYNTPQQWYKAYRSGKGPHGRSYTDNYWEIEARQISKDYRHITLLAYAS